jgi:hypothetical protein
MDDLLKEVKRPHGGSELSEILYNKADELGKDATIFQWSMNFLASCLLYYEWKSNKVSRDQCGKGRFRQMMAASTAMTIVNSVFEMVGRKALVLFTALGRSNRCRPLPT